MSAKKKVSDRTKQKRKIERQVQKVFKRRTEISQKFGFDTRVPKSLS